MRYSVDKIENDIVLLENIKDGNKLEVDIKKIPSGIKETDILYFDGKTYVKDDEEKQKRVDKIREKMNKLRK